ncbi:MAG: c-type cytochrome [Pseudomonadota bacterium]
MRRFSLLLCCLALIAGGLWVGGRREARSLALPVLAPDASAIDRGTAAFIGADFGGLSLDALQTNAIPWRLAAASLVLDAQAQDPDLPRDLQTLAEVLSGFGFLTGAEIANAPEGMVTTGHNMPLGITFGDLAPIAGTRLRVANLGCAACHAGVAYDDDGRPDPGRAWLGMPNTSINLEAYTLALFRAMSAAVEQPDVLLATVDALYPDLGAAERYTLRWAVLPMVRARLNEIDGARPLPFSNGQPGSTNGVAALKYVFGVPLLDGGPGDAGIVSVPDLGYRHWRTGFLVDGAYGVPGTDQSGVRTAANDTPAHRAALAAITTFFTVPSMGVSPDRALTQTAVAEDILTFLSDAYRPQTFPGQIDSGLAARGAEIYAAQCAACHGTYATDRGAVELVSFPNWIGDVGTDPLRADVFSDTLLQAFPGTPYATVMEVRRTGAYAAPPLTGLWASAPYLHNGSVPTLAALLAPSTRPAQFQVGGHALDFERMGILLEDGRYPDGYVPFSDPVTYDTRQAGQGNAGHTYGRELTPADRFALIEFLKRL